MWICSTQLTRGFLRVKPSHKQSANLTQMHSSTRRTWKGEGSIISARKVSSFFSLLRNFQLCFFLPGSYNRICVPSYFRKISISLSNVFKFGVRLLICFFFSFIPLLHYFCYLFLYFPQRRFKNVNWKFIFIIYVLNYCLFFYSYFRRNIRHISFSRFLSLLLVLNLVTHFVDKMASANGGFQICRILTDYDCLLLWGQHN